MAESKLAVIDNRDVSALQKRQPKDIDYHLKEWTSGTRGGGSVPADLDWNSNPKQYQEENGSAALRIPAETVRDSQSE